MARIRGKTVYLLGAGFSVGSGTPLLRTFIPDGINLLKQAVDVSRVGDEDKPSKEFVKQIEATLHHYLPAAEFLPDRLVNLEDLFCLVDLRKQYYEGNQSGNESPFVHEPILKRFVVEVLERAWENHQEAWVKLCGGKDNQGKEQEGQRGTTLADPIISAAPLVVPQRCLFSIKNRADRQPQTDNFYNVCAYEAFLSQILHRNEQKGSKSPDDADFIITLNYDMVIERKLRRISTAPVYYGKLTLDEQTEPGNGSRTQDLPQFVARWPVSGPAPLPLLKIHGSIKWQVSPSVDASAPDFISSFWKPGGGRMNKDSNIKRIPIIPPTWRKTAASKTVFARLLGQALHHMKLADRIVIVGYSIPSTDAYFRYLLAEALGTPVLPTIELWDVIPPGELKERIKQALGERIERVTKPASKLQKGFLELVCSRSIPNPA